MIKKRGRGKIASNFKFFYITQQERHEQADKNSWLSRCNQNKTKTVPLYVTHLMCSLLLILLISLQLVAHYGKSLPSLLVFTFFIAAAVLRKPCQEYFKDPARVGLAVLKNIVIFWKFRNGSVKLFGNTSEENWFLIF